MNGSITPVVLVDPYADMTVMHPFVAVVLLLLCIGVLRAPRKYAIVPFIIAMNFIPFGVRVYFFGMNFTAMRILIVIALARILLRREASSLKLTALDGLVILFEIVVIGTHVLQIGTFHSFMAAIGGSLDTFWAYVVVRLLVRDTDDVHVMARAAALLSLLLCVLMIYESRTGLNSLRAFGGVVNPLGMRGTRFRVQGAYGSPILVGAFWASVLPLVVAYRYRNGHRSGLMYLSAFCIVVIVYLTDSSTPLVSLAVAILGSILYYQRDSVPPLAITAAAAMMAIAIFWWHPIWFLFTKLNVTGHSTSYFRYLLLNAFFQHWRSWFLIGTRYTFDWGGGLGLAGAGLADTVNQFVNVGASSGIIGLSSFVCAIAVGFRYLGRLVSFARNAQERRAYWYLGVSLLAHITSFMGVDYFDQVTFAWWMTLAIASSLYSNRLLTRYRQPAAVRAVGVRSDKEKLTH